MLKILFKPIGTVDPTIEFEASEAVFEPWGLLRISFLDNSPDKIVHFLEDKAMWMFPKEEHLNGMYDVEFKSS